MLCILHLIISVFLGLGFLICKMGKINTCFAYVLRLLPGIIHETCEMLFIYSNSIAVDIFISEQQHYLLHCL